MSYSEMSLLVSSVSESEGNVDTNWRTFLQIKSHIVSATEVNCGCVDYNNRSVVQSGTVCSLHLYVKNFLFSLNSLAINMKQTCHSAFCVLLVIEFIYLLIKYSVNLANIGFTYVRWLTWLSYWIRCGFICHESLSSASFSSGSHSSKLFHSIMFPDYTPTYFVQWLNKFPNYFGWKYEVSWGMGTGVSFRGGGGDRAARAWGCTSNPPLYLHGMHRDDFTYCPDGCSFLDVPNCLMFT